MSRVAVTLLLGAFLMGCLTLGSGIALIIHDDRLVLGIMVVLLGALTIVVGVLGIVVEVQK